MSVKHKDTLIMAWSSSLHSVLHSYNTRLYVIPPSMAFSFLYTFAHAVPSIWEAFLYKVIFFSPCKTTTCLYIPYLDVVSLKAFLLFPELLLPPLY